MGGRCFVPQCLDGKRLLAKVTGWGEQLMEQPVVSDSLHPWELGEGVSSQVHLFGESDDPHQPLPLSSQEVS